MDLGLTGMRAVVTGGSKGIGRAVADMLADEGCNVAICARDAAGVDATVKALTAKGVRFLEAPRDEAYGWVAVFEDKWGNRWDLLQLADSPH